MTYTKKEVDKAVELLSPLLNGMAENRSAVSVKADKIRNKDYIVVTINGYNYNVCVEFENVRSMVKSVIDAVALKL